MGKPKPLTREERAILDSLRMVIEVRAVPSVLDFINEYSRREIKGAQALAALCLAGRRRTLDEARAIVNQECPNPYPDPAAPREQPRRAPALMEA